MAQPSHAEFVSTPTRSITAAGAKFIYREVGAGTGIPLIALTHLGGNLDSWDPEVVDPLAEDRRVILIAYRGVGASTGSLRDSFADAASDAIAVIRGLGLSKVDLLGLSMGGMVAQAIIAREPDLVERLILAGSGPRGGPGLTEMTGVFLRGVLRGAVTFANPTSLLFFTRTPNGTQAARAYQTRLKLRRNERDAAVGLGVLRAQLRAVNRWGREQPATQTAFAGRVLILHGDTDRMVPAANADSLAAQFPAASVHIYPDSGHGVVSQNHEAVTATIRTFLSR